MGKYKGTLSKDLPGGRVAVPDGSTDKSYYKYYSEEITGLTASQKEEIRARIFKKGEGLEIEDRTRLQEEAAFPAADGVYPLKGGGLLTVANVKTPDITGEMLGWWASWHGLDPLRYAIWNPQDHYSVEVIKNRDRLLDDSIPPGERVWTTTHKILESFDQDAPSNLQMDFYSPWECGYDKALEGTDRLMYAVTAQGYMNGKIPTFATEMLVKGEDGLNEVRCRFWIGYERQPDGSIRYKLPRFIRPPKKIVEGLVIHNIKEWVHLNKILPSIYAEEKDNW